MGYNLRHMHQLLTHLLNHLHSLICLQRLQAWLHTLLPHYVLWLILGRKQLDIFISILQIIVAIFDFLHKASDVDHLVLPCQHLIPIILKDVVDNLQDFTYAFLEVAVMIDVQVPFDRQGMVNIQGGLYGACFDIDYLTVLFPHQAQEVPLHLDTLYAIYALFEDFFHPDQMMVCGSLTHLQFQLGQLCLPTMLAETIFEIFSLISQDINRLFGSGDGGGGKLGGNDGGNIEIDDYALISCKGNISLVGLLITDRLYAHHYRLPQIQLIPQ